MAKNILRLIGRLKAKLRKAEYSRVQLSTIEQRNVHFARTVSLPVTFICSFPRSGNTWLRHLMADCILQQLGYKCDTKLPIHPDKLIPDIHCHAAEEVASFSFWPQQLFYKTHFSPAQMSIFLGGESSTKTRYIHLFRNPEDALVSFYNFKLRYQESCGDASSGLDAFCLRELDSWIQHTKGALTCGPAFKQPYLLRYEDLHRETAVTLGRLWRFLQIDINLENCLRAAEHMQFDALQRLEIESDANNSGIRFFRKGRIGSAREDLKPETIDAIRAKTAGVMEELDRFSLNAANV